MKQKRCEESDKRKSQKKENAGARKGRKFAKHCVFPRFCGSGGSKSRLAKAAGAEPSGEMRDKKCTPLRREAHCAKHTILGMLLEVSIFKKSTPLWHEAHLEVNI